MHIRAPGAIDIQIAIGTRNNTFKNVNLAEKPSVPWRLELELILTAFVHHSTGDPHAKMIDVRGDAGFFLDDTAGIRNCGFGELACHLGVWSNVWDIVWVRAQIRGCRASPHIGDILQNTLGMLGRSNL